MKKNILTIVICIACCVITGIVSYTYGYNKSYADSVECGKWFDQLLEQYQRLDGASRCIIDNQCLDTDGSDAMSDYMKIRNKIDSMYNDVEAE